jgi:pimeloyl-ACP methyl ester carboxylesterase
MTHKPSHTFILVHGAWQGAWAWDNVVPRLKAAGQNAIAADLPGDGSDNTPPADVTLDAYADRMAALIDQVEGSIVLVGHSMGGVTVQQTCEARCDRIALAIYLCAFLLPDGMSILEFYGKFLKPEMRGAHSRVTHDKDGLTSAVDPASAIEVFYHQSEPAAAQAAARRLTPQPEGARRSRTHLSAARFGTVPRVYIEALEDRSVHLPLQRQMQQLTRCAATYALKSDHAPQLSQPDVLVRLLLQAAEEHARTL